MKRIKLTLTLKQAEAIKTALFEWGELEELTESPVGRKNAAQLQAIRRSIERQMAAQKGK